MLPGTNKCLFGGFRYSRWVNLVRRKPIGMEVSADMEFVIEGYVGSNVHPGRDVVFNQGRTDPGAPGLTTREIRDLVTRCWAEYAIGQDPGVTG